MAQHVPARLGWNLYGVDRCRRSQGSAMDHFVVFLIFNAGCLLGFLLVPLLGDRGLFLVVLACSLLLVSWVWRAPR